MNPVALTEREFRARFKGGPRVFYAPGRVNLIGEHTDYNQGFVMPAAISFGTCVAISPRKDTKLVLYSVEFGESREFELSDQSHSRERHWSDYVRGVALVLKQSGYALRGANVVVHGNVPIGAGLSSSAATEVASALAFVTVNELAVSTREIAQICQRAENEFVGARCGIMDQFVSVHGQADSALLLDCRSLDYELVPIPQGLTLVVCNTMIKHDLAAGEYNARRAECEEGVRLLRGRLPGIEALRDVSVEGLERNRQVLPPIIYHRCRHVVTEDERVGAAAQALRAGDLSKVGELMAQSHQSLRDDYEVSCAELDTMVEIASGLRGVIGSRMTGGGFGGCTINLVANEAVESFRSRVATEYKKQTGIDPQVYVSSAGNGASEITFASDGKSIA